MESFVLNHLFCRFLDQVSDGTVFIVLCFITRCINAVGFSAAVTSSFAISAKVFPDNIATVLVSCARWLFSLHLMSKNIPGNGSLLFVWQRRVVSPESICDEVIHCLTGFSRSLPSLECFVKLSWNDLGMCLYFVMKLITLMFNVTGLYGDFYRAWSDIGTSIRRLAVSVVRIWNPICCHGLSSVCRSATQYVDFAEFWLVWLYIYIPILYI